MSEGIWIGGHQTTEEEREQIEADYRQRQNEGGYYDGQMPAPYENEQAEVSPDLNPEGLQPEQTEQPQQPQPSDHYMANPANFAEVWSKFDQDPNYEDEHYSRQQVESLYDYYNYKNNGKPMDQWGPLMADDEYVTKEIERNNWYDPVREQKIQEAENQNDMLEIYRPENEQQKAFTERRETGDWNDLDWVGQTFAAVTTTDQGLQNAPDWTKKTQAGAQALSSAMAGPTTLKMIGAIAGSFGGEGIAAALSNPYVLLGAGLLVGGLTFYSAVTGKEIPVFQKFLELSDLADTVTEHALGYGAQAVGMAKTNFSRANEDPNDAYGFWNALSDTIKDIGTHSKAMWDTGEYFYEMYGSVGDFAVDALKEIFMGQEGTKQGEAWFFNRGINEKQQLAEGTYGQSGLSNIREMFEEMDRQGIDKDLQQAFMQQAVINAAGTSGNVSDYVAQMMLDLDILSTPLQNEGAGLVSRIAGDSRGVEATQINRGSMLTQLPFVGQIIQGATGKKAPGGVMEWMDIRKNLARTADVSTLTAADRFFGGIDANGRIKEFARTDKTGLADMLPESKVAGVGNIASNVLNAFMYDAEDTNDIRNRLASLRGDAEGTYNSGMNNSADVLTVRDGMKAAMTKSDPEIYLKQFDNSAEARAKLTQTAEALGMEVKDVLSLYSETPAVFEQRVRDYAAQHNNMIAGIDVTNGVDPVSTIIRGFTTSKDGKGAPLAWNIKQVQYQITTSLIDGMAEYYTDYYGVKPNSTINTVFDTMKSAQSLLLLGWSPSYFINNVINNAVTSAAEGVLGFMTPTQIRQWMDAFGVAPARMDVDVNAEFRGQSGDADAFSKAVSQAKKEGTDKGLQGVLTGINGLLKKANDKLGVFSSLSGKMETLQGNQLTAVAIQQYWGQRWKRGEGFHLMPTALVETIEQQTPGMTNVIYQAIENGLSMEQISRTLFDTYVKPDAGTVMKAVCESLFRGEANVYEEIFEKSGVMRDLSEKIRNCKTEEERQTVINEARDKIQNYVENLRREDLIQRANNVAVTVEAEGLAPVSQMMSELEMNHQDFWIRQRQQWTDAYTRMLTENLDGPARRALLAELVSRQRKEWSDLYKQEITTAAGIMKGLGFKHESHVKYIGLMNESNQNWVDFNDAKSRELVRAYERTQTIIDAAGKGKKGDRVQIEEVWDDFRRNTAELYDQHFAREQELKVKMDAAFVEGYEYSTGKSGDQLRQNFQRINEIRQRMHDMQKDAHEKTAKMTAEEKAKFYEDYNPKYNALIREIGNIGDANAKIIDDTASSGPGYEDRAPVNMTPEQTVQATETMETNNALREKAMRERAGYLDREGIKQGWIDAGRMPAEADLMMTVFDAAADQWARDNGAYPDEFYSQAVQLKGIANWQVGGTTVQLQDGAGNLYQVDTIRPADINTENFRNWFRNSKIVDANGKPLIVYHGTAEQFEVFRKQKANDKLGRSMGLGLGKDKFYLTTERAAGEAFARSAESLGRGKNPQVMELYVSIQNPIMQSEYESRLAQKYLQYENSDPRQPGYDYRARDRAIAALDREIKAEGYDGIWDQDSGQIAVFEPTQIKSIYNGGEWSPNDPNILHQTSVVETSRTDEDSYQYVNYDITADGKVIGYASIMVDDNSAYCERIDIDEEYRNQGYGTAALYNLSSMYDGITVAPDNEDAKRLYDRIGYESSNEYYDQGYGVYEIPTNSLYQQRIDYSVLHQTTAEYAAKYYDQIMAHYGNENFRNWFGIGTDHQSKVVDEYGMPLVVHHGTNATFEIFSKDKLGENTIAESAKQGFFFTDDEDTALSYTNSAEEIMLQYIMQGALDSEERNRDKVYTEADRADLIDKYKKLYDYANDQWEPDRYSININNIYSEVEAKYYGSFAEYILPPEVYEAATGIEAKYIEASIDGLNYLLDHTDDLNDGKVMDTYLYMQNPLVYDYQGESFSDAIHTRIIEQAKAEGHDGVIFKNVIDRTRKGNEIFTSQTAASTVYCVFDPHQIKSIENDGTFNKLDPNILHQQAVDSIKGTFEHTDAGNIIRMLNASDVSTMVHESGHLFRRTLSQPLLQEFTTWAGFKDVAEFQELEIRWRQGDPTLSEADRQRYVDAEEKFARGFEQYLMDGSAPTPGLKAVFKSFRDYLLDIYQKVKATVTGNDYSGQGEFVFHGATGDEVLNINAEINGVKLRDIFDRMLTDDVQRTPGFQELVTNLRTQLGQDRHNMRMSDKALTRRAQAEVTRTILQNFGSMEAAEAALQNYDTPMEINGWRVDDGTLYEAIQSAKSDATMNPFAQAEYHQVKGTNTYAYSITDANSGKKYQLQYKVVELEDLQPSNVWFGDQLIINEDYPADAQARNRSADQSDVYSHAANLNPGLLIDEQRAIDSGAPIVGEGNMFVESGNGRVLSMLYAKDHFPEQWANYQEYLRNSVGDYGIDPAQLDGFENPVLIRERLGGDSVTFAEDANSNRNKVMTASENALTDANKVNMDTLAMLDIQPGESIDTFTTEKNAQPSVEWLRSLPEMERARYSTTNRTGDLILSADGRTRFINALFATLYATPESMDIIRSFSETSDSNIQALESALKQSLPEMARAEGLIRSGSRAENLSITADVMAAAGLLQEARKAGINIHDYLAQATIPGMERWTPTQALLAGFFGDAKNNVKKIRDFFNAYGEEVYKAGDPNQLSLFSDAKTREQMINDSLSAALGTASQEAEAAANVQRNAAPNAAEGPVLNQSVLDSDEKWTSQFAKVLDENLQRTFDEGMSMPLDQAESVYLRGDVNTAFETRLQRLLRDFSNDKNLSPDQYLYAWDYMEWWVQGSNGEAPKGNPIWEADIQKMVMQDFTNEHPDLVRELQRRYKTGAEIDPDTAVPAKGEFVKRTYGFEHGFWNIAGNVYKDGKLIAFLPEELDRMQKTIEVDGQSYKVLGVDRQNPEGLVYYDPVLEIVRTVNVGKPEGFDEPRNPFAFIKPSRQGSTPQTMPVADAYSELSQKYLMPALEAFGAKYTEADTDARTKQMSGLNLQTRAQLLQWLDQDVAEDMRAEKYRAMKYSDMKKDAAMLNYNQRYGFDPILTMLSPYQFWYTRSMWKWAKRMIDKPALGNAYQRMQEYEDKNRQENLPSRLSGRWRIPMPFLPDWMGGSYYVDLNAQLFPFSKFGQSYSSNMNQATLNARAESILQEMVDAELITAQQMREAVDKKEGAVWQNAFAQAEVEIGKEDGLSTLASQFISPSIFFTWAQAKQNGEDPGTLSGTRTGNAIKALTGDIPLVSTLGNIVGDAMTMPEQALRKLYGFEYNEFGQYGDQQIRKQISQMVADREIDWRKGLAAMIEKSGTIWNMAADRQRKEAMLKVPTFAGAEAAKQFAKGNASLGDTMRAMIMSLMGGGLVYPTGEQELRAEQASRDDAYLREAAGDKNAVSDWYKENPNYVTRTATYMNDPEELLKYTLYQNISWTYYNQPYARQQDLAGQLGPEFRYAILNKETRNYKAVPIQKLAEWNAQIGGLNPNVGSIDVEGVERVMKLSDPVVNVIQEHDDYVAQNYPGIKVIQDGYYALPKDQRKAYLQQFPQLNSYWEYNRQFKNAHPEYEQWNDARSAAYNEDTYYNTYADMSQYTQQQLAYAKATGQPVSATADYELNRLYAKYANPSFLSYEDFVKALISWE